jgi:hypothetical protein
MVIVVQNIISSLFNSHLFDFVQGWTYVLGVGVAGGTVLRRREREKPVKQDDPDAKADFQDRVLRTSN